MELSKQGRDYDETLLLLMRQLPQPNGIKDSADHKVFLLTLLVFV